MAKKKEAKKLTKWHTIPWDKGVYLMEMMQGRDAMKILSIFATLKNARIDSYEQMLFFIKRNLKSAESLTIFPLEQVEKTLKYLLKNANYKVTLETVEKYITEDIEVLDGKEPIIKLTNGETVYDIQRLGDLEREGRIFYNGKTWLER